MFKGINKMKVIRLEKEKSQSVDVMRVCLESFRVGKSTGSLTEEWNRVDFVYLYPPPSGSYYVN